MPHNQAEAVDALVADLLKACLASRRADCDAILKKHPEHASELAAFLDDYNMVAQRFAPLRELSAHTTPNAAEVATLGQDDTAVPPPPRAGGSFGDYDLLSEIARGGMGVVYKARQKSLNRIVALKMVLGGQRDSSMDRHRFLVEARAVARLNHPHVVPIYEVGEHDGQPYFTMEFFAGGSLRDQLDAMRGDQRTIARMMVTAARAVEHAHRRGILHRDIKPNNVLLDERGEPHVTDFGLAKQLDEESDLTQAGAIVGTPSYMAPEQAGAATDLTTAVDVYGLGALLYELLTGRPPFRGNTPLETMMAAVSKEPLRPRRLSPEIDADLETICLKCLEKDPLARYSSADALADDLQRWLDGKPIHARPVTTTERLVKWSRRQPLLAGTLATVVLSVVVLLVLAGVLWQNAELRAQTVQDLDDARGELAEVDEELQQAAANRSKAEKLADEQRQLADEQKTLAAKIAAEVERLQAAARAAEKRLETAKSEARHTAYAADMLLAHAAWQNENLPTARELIDRYDRPAGAEDLRGFEWHYLHRQVHAARRSWQLPGETGKPTSIVGLAVSPDGKTLASAQPQGRIELWNLADGSLLRTIAKGKGVPGISGLFFEDEGQKLLAIVRKDIDPTESVRLAQTLVQNKAEFELDSLGKWLEFHVHTLDGDSPVRVEPFDSKRLGTSVFPLLSGGLILVADQGMPWSVKSMDRSADGRFVALAVAKAGGGTQTRLLVWDLKEGRLHGERVTRVSPMSVAFSPRGDALAIGRADGVVSIAQLDLAEPPRMMTGHAGLVTALCFNGDGARLASGGEDGTAILWDVAEAKELERFRGQATMISRLEFADGDRTLVTGGLQGRVHVWDVARSDPFRVFRGHKRDVGSLAFTDDGGKLVSVDLSGVAKTWQLPGDQWTEANAKPDLRFVLEMQLSPNGHAFAWKKAISNTIVVQDLADGGETRLTWEEHRVSRPAFSPDGKLVAAGSQEPGGLIVWNVTDGKMQATIDGPDWQGGMVYEVSFSPDGKLVAAACFKGVTLWDRTSGSMRTLTDKCAVAVAFSPDNRLLATAVTTGTPYSKATVLIWDLEAGQVVCEFDGAGAWAFSSAGVQWLDLAFSPDGRRLATIGSTSPQRGTLKLWDIAGGREVYSAALPPGRITAIAWSPDSHRLAAGLTPAAVDTPPDQSPGDVYVLDATPVAQSKSDNVTDSSRP